MTPVRVLVIIVNYRTPALAVDAAASIEEEVRARGDTHVVIVDNGSGDDSADHIAVALHQRGYGGWCSLLAEERNGGFAAGNNAALRWCREATGAYPDHAWLLNPDTRAEPGALGALVAFLDAHADAGIAGSRCLEPDGTVWASAFRFQSLRSELADAIRFTPVTRLLGSPTTALPQREVPAPADWVSGASMMIRRAVIDRIGLMDEGYFLYFEETDYCARAAAAGFGIWTVPESRVLHLGGQATGVTDKAPEERPRPRYWFASRARYFIARGGVLKAQLVNLAWLVAYPIGRAISRLRGRRYDYEPWRFWRDFARAYYGRNGIMYRPSRRARRMGTDEG